MRLGLGVAAGVAAALAGATPAQAAQLYAAPDGSGTACTKAQPCSLKQAITSVPSDSEVTVEAGSYVTEEQLLTPSGSANVYVHGDLGGPMPRITNPKGGLPVAIIEVGGTLSYLELISTGTVATGAVCNPPGRIERVRVSASGNGGAIGVRLNGDCEVRDSVFRASGEKSVGILASFVEGDYTGVARNVTAIASGADSTGIRAHFAGFFEKGTYTLDLKNAIARGEASDLSATQTTEGTGHLLVSNSNYVTAVAEGAGTITTTGPVQTAPPLFVDAAAGDYREAAGSPSIDAGSNDRIGALDLAGNPRSLGTAPDIGAYEFAPPATPAPGGVRSLSIRPRRFGAWRSGGPVAPAILKSKPPKGATVTYTLTGPATVTFSASRRVQGRLAGKRCGRKTSANAGHRRCTFYVPVKGSFTQAGAAGDNRFIFSGRIGGRALRPGAYKLTAFAGHLVSAPFEIGGLRRHRGRG